MKLRTLYDFPGGEGDQLTFSAGDVLTLVDDSDAIWWIGVDKNGTKGTLPANYVQEIVAEKVGAVGNRSWHLADVSLMFCIELYCLS